jgi:hypothetical protein
VSECDQVTVKTLDTCCEQIGRRGKDYETKLLNAFSGIEFLSLIVFSFTALEHFSQAGPRSTNLQKDPRNNGSGLPGPLSNALSNRTEGKHSSSSSSSSS